MSSSQILREVENIIGGSGFLRDQVEDFGNWQDSANLRLDASSTPVLTLSGNENCIRTATTDNWHGAIQVPGDYDDQTDYCQIRLRVRQLVAETAYNLTAAVRIVRAGSAIGSDLAPSAVSVSSALNQDLAFVLSGKSIRPDDILQCVITVGSHAQQLLVQSKFRFRYRSNIALTKTEDRWPDGGSTLG